MDGTVNRGARVECRVGQPIAAVAEPAGFPVRRGAAIQAVRRPCVQRALLRSARDTRSATPTAVRTAAFWLAAGAGAATDGFLLDSALTCCLLTVWATPAGQSIGLGGSLQGRDFIETTGLADPGPVAQTFFMDDEIAETYLIDSILTLVDAKHANQQLDDRQEARRQVGFADQLFLSKTDLVSEDEKNALIHRLKHMNPRAPIRAVHFGEVSLNEVFDLRGFNLNAKLDIDPDFLKEDDHDHGHDHGHKHEHDEHCGHDHGHEHDENCGHDHAHDHEHGEHCKHPLHHHHDDDVKSFVYRADRAFDPARLEDFLGAIVNIYGPRMLRYKGVLNMQGTERKVIFQGVHQLMGSDLGPQWAEGEKRQSKMVFIGIDLPQDIFLQGLEQCLV